MKCVRRTGGIDTMKRPRRGMLAIALVSVALAGCGGDDDDNGSSSGGGNSARPAETILAGAGLEICGEAQDQYAQSIGDEGPQNVQAFAVADDCGGKKTSAD